MEGFWNNLKQFFWNFINGYGLNLVKALAIFVLGLLIIRHRDDDRQKEFGEEPPPRQRGVHLHHFARRAGGVYRAGADAGRNAGLFHGGHRRRVLVGDARHRSRYANALSSLTNGSCSFSPSLSGGGYVDIGGTAGTVKEIKLFSVKIVTPDNLTVVIPNSTVLESVITNYSRMSLRRLDVVVPVSYNADVGR